MGGIGTGRDLRKRSYVKGHGKIGLCFIISFLCKIRRKETLFSIHANREETDPHGPAHNSLKTELYELINIPDLPSGP